MVILPARICGKTIYQKKQHVLYMSNSKHIESCNQCISHIHQDQKTKWGPGRYANTTIALPTDTNTFLASLQQAKYVINTCW